MGRLSRAVTGMAFALISLVVIDLYKHSKIIKLLGGNIFMTLGWARVVTKSLL